MMRGLGKANWRVRHFTSTRDFCIVSDREGRRLLCAANCFFCLIRSVVAVVTDATSQSSIIILSLLSALVQFCILAKQKLLDSTNVD